MQREIKFRGKCLNGGWVYGNLNVITDKRVGVEPGYYISNSVGMPFAYAVRPETVGQYIEAKDKNCKEVYDGDVLKDKNGKLYKIVWGFGLLWLAKTNETQGNCYSPQGLINHGTTVIGNIYENPELLK